MMSSKKRPESIAISMTSCRRVIRADSVAYLLNRRRCSMMALCVLEDKVKERGVLVMAGRGYIRTYETAPNPLALWVR